MERDRVSGAAAAEPVKLVAASAQEAKEAEPAAVEPAAAEIKSVELAPPPVGDLTAMGSKRLELAQLGQLIGAPNAAAASAADKGDAKGDSAPAGSAAAGSGAASAFSPIVGPKRAGKAAGAGAGAAAAAPAKAKAAGRRPAGRLHLNVNATPLVPFENEYAGASLLWQIVLD